MATYFITGISGLVGSNLVRAIFAHDPEATVVGLVFPDDPCPYLDKEKITLAEGNILDMGSLKSFLKTKVPEGKRYLIHAAGRISVYRNNDDLTYKVNVEGTRNVLEAAKSARIDRFLFLSSVDALGKVPMGQEIFEQSSYDPTHLEGVYSRSKAIASQMVLDSGLDCIIVNPSAILGPYDPAHNPIDDAIKRFLNNKLPAVVKGSYDLVDVRDVAEGILLLLENGKSRESYLLTGNQYSILDFMGVVAKVSGKKPVRHKVPTWLVKIASPFIEFSAKKRGKSPLFTSFAIDCLQQNSAYSHAKASALGYAPRPLEKTVEDTVQWMKESGYLAR
ncbi:MAG: NAD-dependent epimerase/dehydratase family protein [Bacilli bacterium]|nr:NAD-dependent epimerase/dehydratase family protein [Bacilli bacterium]